MANIFSRLFRIGSAEANNLVDKMEDPVKMSQQAIRELKDKLDQALNAQVKLKAVVIGMQTDEQKMRDQATDWESKANALQNKLEKGELDQATADNLTREALLQYKTCLERANQLRATSESQKGALEGMNKKIVELKDLIRDSEAQVNILQARAATASASKAVNKELSDSGGVDNLKDLLKRMQNKVSENENLAEAYVQLDNENADTATQINKVLGNQEGADLLADFKRKRAGSPST